MRASDISDVRWRRWIYTWCYVLLLLNRFCLPNYACMSFPPLSANVEWMHGLHEEQKTKCAVFVFEFNCFHLHWFLLNCKNFHCHVLWLLFKNHRIYKRITYTSLVRRQNDVLRLVGAAFPNYHIFILLPAHCVAHNVSHEQTNLQISSCFFFNFTRDKLTRC